MMIINNVINVKMPPILLKYKDRLIETMTQVMNELMSGRNW
jgi:hypothetical protein